jgi:hypothetical protein
MRRNIAEESLRIDEESPKGAQYGRFVAARGSGSGSRGAGKCCFPFPLTRLSERAGTWAFGVKRRQVAGFRFRGTTLRINLRSGREEAQ